MERSLQRIYYDTGKEHITPIDIAINWRLSGMMRAIHTVPLNHMHNDNSIHFILNRLGAVECSENCLPTSQLVGSLSELSLKSKWYEIVACFRLPYELRRLDELRVQDLTWSGYRIIKGLRTGTLTQTCPIPSSRIAHITTQYISQLTKVVCWWVAKMIHAIATASAIKDTGKGAATPTFCRKGFFIQSVRNKYYWQAARRACKEELVNAWFRKSWPSSTLSYELARLQLLQGYQGTLMGSCWRYTYPLKGTL